MTTPEEKACLDLTAELWNALLRLPAYTHDREEHMRDIHNIQNRILARPARRHPFPEHLANPPQ